MRLINSESLNRNEQWTLVCVEKEGEAWGRCHILLPCRVIYLRCTDDTAEDSETQGRRPGPLYKLQETLKTGDKWPEWPGHRLRLNVKTPSPCTHKIVRQDVQGEEGKREKDACLFPCKNSVFNPVFWTNTEGSLLKPTLLFKGLTHWLISTLYYIRIRTLVLWINDLECYEITISAWKSGNMCWTSMWTF